MVDKMCSGLVVALEVWLLELGGGNAPNRQGGVIEVECEHQYVMAYIMERYANMRGTFFVWHLKCDSRNQIQKLAKRQATRTKVAYAVYCAKVVNNYSVFECDWTLEYKAFWEFAKDCVFELADKEEKDGIDE